MKNLTQNTTFKASNITNIHSHDLHISGTSLSNDVTRLIQGGYCGDYVYEIGADHMRGPTGITLMIMHDPGCSSPWFVWYADC